jgi:hypothetical protein
MMLSSQLLSGVAIVVCALGIYGKRMALAHKQGRVVSG